MKSETKNEEPKNVEVVEKIKPILHVSSSDLPALKGWQVGKTYTVLVKMKQMSMSMDSYSGTNKHRADFEIQSIKPVQKAPDNYPIEAINRAASK